MNVLVIDDDHIARKIISRTLREGGYEVTTANDGDEALALIEQGDFHIVVTDWEMPRLSGIEVCRRLREVRRRHYTYCILVTCRDRPIDAIAGFAEGADDYLTKPFHASELLMRVNAGRRMVQLETANMTIFALAKLAESRDPETRMHLERVRSYSRALALQLQRLPQYEQVIDDEYVDLLYRASPLHDIGKVAIPDHILLKPGPLSKDEFDVMKMHTLHGARTIDSLLEEYPQASFLQMARDIILTHHERWDGSGYPHGLSGESIPLCGRIVALADVYDVLTSRRVYRAAYSHQQARDILLEQSGRQFDPAVVEAFQAIEPQFIQLHEALSDGTPRAAQPIVPPPMALPGQADSTAQKNHRLQEAGA